MQPFAAPLFYAASDLLVKADQLQPKRVHHEWREKEASYKGDMIQITGDTYKMRVSNVLARSGEGASLPHGLCVRARSKNLGELVAYLERYSNAYHFNGTFGLYHLTLEALLRETENIKPVRESKPRAGWFLLGRSAVL